MRKIALTLVLGLFAIAYPQFAAAQSYGGGYSGYDTEDMLEEIGDRLKYIKRELKITDEQEEDWDNLDTSVRDNAEAYSDLMRKMMKDGDYSSTSLPEYLTVTETFLEKRLDQVRAVRDSVEALYAVLEKDQKEIADEMLLSVVGMHLTQ